MDYLAKRDLVHVDRNLQQIFTLTTLKCTEPGEECALLPLGSFSVKAQKYYSDIDVDDVYIGRSILETQKNVTKYLQNIVKDILANASKFVFYSDFKAGGLHWSANDVIRGMLPLPNGGNLLLTDAVLMPEMIKLDIFFYYNSRFIEESVFFKIFVGEMPINVKVSDIVKDIAVDGLHYYEEGNLLKAAKRAFSIAKYLKDMGPLQALGSIVTSEIQILGQIMSDISTIQLMVEKGIAKEVVPQIYDEVQFFKERAANIISFPIDLAIFDLKIPEMKKALSFIANQQTAISLQKLGFNLADYLARGSYAGLIPRTHPPSGAHTPHASPAGLIPRTHLPMK